MAPFFGRYPLPLTSLIASCTSLHSSLCRHNRPADSKIGTGVVRTLPPPRSAILDCNGALLDPAEFVRSLRPKTWPPGGNPVVSSLPVGCARARNRTFSGLNFPHTQIVLLDSSLAWYCFRRLRLFNFRVAQIKECPHDDRNHWPLRVSRIGCDIRLDLSDEKCIR